ncbi:hypothetical protein BDV96DRAFT_642852 [Lophiotrema nucula]|uniref:Uncharacterized protein n=1 Tax=Lophiotrema nucula TaxID=690887 RepID=A0A6A5ZGN4_9PLEO|nr:hypothetical protein BDV96DRAFT_642852 [Lophiotrema nucula]
MNGQNSSKNYEVDHSPSNEYYHDKLNISLYLFRNQESPPHRFCPFYRISALIRTAATKALKSVGKTLSEGGAWKKLATPTVSRGKTAWPKTSSDLENIGIRFNYDDEITQNGVVYHKYQCQPNAGKIPASLKDWREKNGGTHAVITTVLVKKDATKSEVVQAVEEAMIRVKT